MLLWIGVFTSRGLTSRGHAFRGLTSVVWHPGVLHTGILHPGVSRSGVLRQVVWRPWALPSGLLYPWVLPPRVLRQGVLHPADFRKSSTVLSARSVRTQTYFRSALLPEIRLYSVHRLLRALSRSHLTLPLSLLNLPDNKSRNIVDIRPRSSLSLNICPML